jgi:hypothetical protein
MKENKEIIIVVLILILAGFYWFEIRPSSIRKDCSKVFSNKENYDNCLHLHGLKK